MSNNYSNISAKISAFFKTATSIAKDATYRSKLRECDMVRVDEKTGEQDRIVNTVYGHLENINQNNPKPIHSIGLDEFMASLPIEVIKDYHLTFIADCDAVLVPRHILLSVLDVANGYDDFNSRSFGAMDSVEKTASKHLAFSKELSKARQEGTHF